MRLLGGTMRWTRARGSTEPIHCLSSHRRVCVRAGLVLQCTPVALRDAAAPVRAAQLASLEGCSCLT